MTAFTVCLAVVGVAAVAADAVDEWRHRQRWAAAETARMRRLRPRPSRPHRARPELVRAREYALRHARALDREAARLEQRIGVVRGEACRWLHRADLADAAIAKETR